MKTKLLSFLAVSLIMVGCAHEPIIKYEYIEKRVPVNAVPAPPKLEKPVYETTTLTKEDRKDIGIFTQAIVVENKQKDGYIEILEMVINKYKDLAAEAEITVAPLTLPEPPAKESPKP